jgi:Ca2+/H+ antiporter, TMEM165/GDT1 family
VPELAVIGIAFAVTFLAELPDKSMFASLVLGTRYRASWVWAGAATAFAVQMGIAVSAGQLLTLFPHRVLAWIVAGLFLAAGSYLIWASFRPAKHENLDEATEGGDRSTFLRVAGTAFVVIFLAEWGDITQIAAANLAARYNPVLVFAGATLGLWVAAAIAVNIGAKSLSLLPAAWINRICGAILLALGGYAVFSAVTAHVR